MDAFRRRRDAVVRCGAVWCGVMCGWFGSPGHGMWSVCVWCVVVLCAGNYYYAERCAQVKEERPDLEGKDRMLFIG